MKKIFLSYSGSRVRKATRRFSRKIVFHCWIKLSISSVLAVFLMYFTIKYNAFYKYIINATTTTINACKKVIYVSYLTRESTLYFLNVNKYWHDRKRWEKEANIVKGARFCYCRIYHKFGNFIILNLFKFVKWKSCFILIWNRNGHECSRIWKLSANFMLIQSIKKCQDFLGLDISGTTFFMAESSLIQSNCRSLWNLKS